MWIPVPGNTWKECRIMKYIKEKIAYLKGYADGMKLSEKSDEGKALLKVYEILDDITDALDGLALAQSETDDRLEDMSDDIEFLEEYVYDLDDFDEDDDDLFEVTCPKCGENYFVDYDDFDSGDVFCPFCGEDFDLDDETVAKLMAAENGDPCACCHCEAAEGEDIPF